MQPDVTITPGLLAGNALHAALCVWLVVAGLAVAVHYHCMANFITKAPHWVRGVVLPVLTAAGVGMVWAGLSGNVPTGALFALLAAGLMPAVHLAAWAAGAYVAEQFERAERLKRQRYAFLRDAVDGATDMAKFLDSGSNVTQLASRQDATTQDKARTHERH